MTGRASGRVSFTIGLLYGVALLMARLAAAHPVHTIHGPTGPTHPHAPHQGPGHPGVTPTPAPADACPGVPVACPMPAPCTMRTKISKLFYAYPGSQRSLRASGFFYLDQKSSGIDPVNDGGSLTLTDATGAVVLDMPSLQFEPDGAGFTATNEQGSVRIAPFAGIYSFQFSFDHPDFPPGYFSVLYHMCLSIGDDGMVEQIVCQKKPNGGFLCHR